MATLTIQNLHKSYGEARVVDDVTVQVSDGEFIVLVGPSGCGKSTTLRMIAGLEGIDGGTISIGERKVNDLHPADRDIAMVFQSYALYPHMSVHQNIAYGLKRRKVSRGDIDDRVKQVAATLKLEGLLLRRPSQLSGGQRQRVALGRAIVRQPAVFLMDEPLSNLDAKLRVEMRAELTRLHAALDATMIYVTHDQVEAMTMGDRIVVMNAGRIEQIGTPLEVYSNPASLFVAKFLGLPEINMISGKVTADSKFVGDGIALDLPGVKLGNREVILGLRPQDLTALAVGRDQSEGLGVASVTAVEHHGPESFATVLLGETPLTLRIAPLDGIQVGMSVQVHLDHPAPHFFDPDTGLRICLPPQLEE